MFMFFDLTIPLTQKKKKNLQKRPSVSLSPPSRTPHSIRYLASQPARFSHPSPPPSPSDPARPKAVPGTGRQPWSPGRPCPGFPLCFQGSEAKDIGRAGIRLDFLEPLTTWGTPMVPGGGCCALAALLVIADIRLGGKDGPPPGPQGRDSHQGGSWTREEGWTP